MNYINFKRAIKLYTVTSDIGCLNLFHRYLLDIKNNGKYIEEEYHIYNCSVKYVYEGCVIFSFYIVCDLSNTYRTLPCTFNRDFGLNEKYYEVYGVYLDDREVYNFMDMYVSEHFNHREYNSEFNSTITSR